MANFQRAIEWLKSGGKVRRPMWKENSYWKLGIEESIRWIDGVQAHIHLNQIAATDWEVCEEKCSACGQIDRGQTSGAFHCPKCRLPRIHDEEEFDLSEKISCKGSRMEHVHTPNIKEFIKRQEKENKDLEEDIIDLTEISDYNKEDLILKIKRLCKAHKEERDKLAGKKLI